MIQAQIRKEEATANLVLGGLATALFIALIGGNGN